MGAQVAAGLGTGVTFADDEPQNDRLWMGRAGPQGQVLAQAAHRPGRPRRDGPCRGRPDYGTSFPFDPKTKNNAAKVIVNPSSRTVKNNV
ncbi:hypothetical protein [Streptomyces phaeofaciens]|uniref:hypothetical protein n=1 Tax=Streptomyces phaeofaciens TaxID=68254 RepID=UPI003690800C